MLLFKTTDQFVISMRALDNILCTYVHVSIGYINYKEI